jgi:hypothetical protein
MTLVMTGLLWGTVIGVIHFVVVGALYGNPIVDRVYAGAAGEPGVRIWTSKPRYLLTQFLGTQVEIYILSLAFIWLRPMVAIPGLGGALALGLVFAGIRVYPRFWNMWIQSTYPGRLLAIELINGTLSTFVVSVGLQLLLRLG